MGMRKGVTGFTNKLLSHPHFRIFVSAGQVDGYNWRNFSQVKA
jgi:hypothetical protein